MQAERAALRVLGLPATDDADVAHLELLKDDCIGPFRILVRGRSEVLLESFGGSAYTWLDARDADGAGDAEGAVELRFGSALPGAGYRGVPLQHWLAIQALMPFHRWYSRLLLRSAADAMQRDAHRIA